MKKVVVFGASGNTGKYFVEYFKSHCSESECKIIATGTRRTDFFEKIGVDYLQVDVTKKDEFSVLPDDVYAVVDLHGAMPARMEGYQPQKYIDVNITGTLNVLDYCKKTCADRILFAQSFGDIKDHAEKNPVLHPDMTRNFSFTSDHTIYVMSKNFAVDMIENYHQMYGLKRFIFRLPTIYLWSPVDHYYVDGKIKKIGYRILIDKAIKGETIEIWGDKTRKKDMVYVKDFCQMLYKAVFVNKNEGYYNVGTGIGTSLENQIKGIVEVFGAQNKKSEIVERPDLPNAPQYIMDITSAVNDLGYHPKFDYISMLGDMLLELRRGGGITIRQFPVCCIPGGVRHEGNRRLYRTGQIFASHAARRRNQTELRAECTCLSCGITRD
jgi:UDP-glucose 4-epimerase